jgi:hypothetical protein
METYRKVEFKTRLFEGYNIWMDIEKYNEKETFDELIKDAKMHLINFLKTFNLKSLEENAKSIDLIVEMYSNSHDVLKKTSAKDTIYLYEKLL